MENAAVPVVVHGPGMDLEWITLCPSCTGWGMDGPRMKNAAVPVAVLKCAGLGWT